MNTNKKKMNEVKIVIKNAETMTEDYAKNLWYIVSGAVECGGLGRESWGFEADQSVGGWKAYNQAGEKAGNYLSLSVRVHMVEEGEALTEYQEINALWLHNTLCDFVADVKTPAWLRTKYAGTLLTKEYPDDADAVSDDAVMQYGFLKEIRFG